MNKFPPLLLLIISCIGASAPCLHASVRLSSGFNGWNVREKRTQEQARLQSVSGWGLPDGDWTLGIWDNNFQGNGGQIINGLSGPDAATSTINLVYDNVRNRYIVGGMDSAGHPFGSGGAVGHGIGAVSGALPGGYAARITGKFTPRLHIIRRRAGHSEYLVAEGGHAPVLVASEERPFGACPPGGWYLGCHRDWADLYDSDLEGLFFATSAVSDKDIALMAAGCKPSSVASISGNLLIYFPLETAFLSDKAEAIQPNLGSDKSIGMKRRGSARLFADGPMLRGATAENNTPAQVTEPTNVVALNGFQPFQIIRHLNGSANVLFTGFDYGKGAADIRIRFLDVEHSTSTPWQTLVARSPGDGAAVKATIPVPRGYWKTIEVERVNSPGGEGNSSRPNRTWSRWAVGEVVAVWGDSIQGLIENSGTGVAANGFTAKYPSHYPVAPGDSNPLGRDMWNLLSGKGRGGGARAENEIANHLSDASQCCVGIYVVWAGATRLQSWNGGTGPYETAKGLFMANGGLNKPNVITWVANRASACYGDDFYKDLNVFKSLLDKDLGAGTWRLVLAQGVVVYDTTPPANQHAQRAMCWRWVNDNPEIAQFGGLSVDHLTGDGVHPNAASWDLMGPRWGNVMGYMRAPGKYADPRGGEIVRFFRSKDGLVAQVQLYAGTALSLKHSGSTISGLTLSSDDFVTTIPIKSAALIDGTSFRITPTITPLPPGPLKLRYLFGTPGLSGSTLAERGVDNILYVNAGPANTIAIQPIYGTASNNWSLAEQTTGASSKPAAQTGTGFRMGIQ